jgi:hypothetical protein
VDWTEWPLEWIEQPLTETSTLPQRQYAGQDVTAAEYEGSSERAASELGKQKKGRVQPVRV